jgi:hypothetical protein
MTPNIKPAALISTKRVQHLLNAREGVFRPGHFISSRGEPKAAMYSLFAAPNHVCDDQSKAMAAKSYKNAILIEYAPHTVGNLLLHVLPPFGARVIVRILQEFDQHRS